MNLIRGTVGKSIITPLLIFIFISVLNFCSIDTLTFSSESEHSQTKPTAERHNQTHGENPSEDTTHSHDKGEDPSCCSNIQAIIAIPQKILLFTQLKDSSLFTERFLFSINRNVPQLSLVRGPINDSGPPGSYLSEFIFLVSFPSHAPPDNQSI